MPTISGALSSSFQICPGNLLRLGSKINTAHHLYSFAAKCPSKVPRLHVKFNNAHDSLQINDLEKTVDHDQLTKRYAHDEYVVGQKFMVRLSELDINNKASLEALLSYTLETNSNLLRSSGLFVGGYCVSKEMSSQNLIWVAGRIQVAVNCYPSWEDLVQVETWCSALGKLSLTCSSRLTDLKSAKTMMRVDSEFMMLDENTRRLSKIPEEIMVRGEPYVRGDLDPFPVTYKGPEFRKLQKLDQQKADYVVKGIKGTPESVRKKYELAAITLEYKRECRREDVLLSLSVASSESPQQYSHLLCLEGGPEVARARTSWRSKDSV